MKMTTNRIYILIFVLFTTFRIYTKVEARAQNATAAKHALVVKNTTGNHQK